MDFIILPERETRLRFPSPALSLLSPAETFLPDDLMPTDVLPGTVLPIHRLGLVPVLGRGWTAVGERC